MLYRAVNADTVEPVQRLLEKQTTGQAIHCFMVSEISLNCTYDSAKGKKNPKSSPCSRRRHTLFISDPIEYYPHLSLKIPVFLFSFCFPNQKGIQVSYLFRTFKFPCFSYYFCFAFGRSRVSNLGSNTGYPDGFHVFTQFSQSNSRPGHNMPHPLLCMTFVPFSATYLMFLELQC